MSRTSEAHGGAEVLAGRIRERNMAAGRQPGRCPNVGGTLRAAIEREAGARCARPPRISLAERALPAIDPPSPRPSVVRLPPSQSLRRDMMAGKLLMALIAGSFGRTLRSARRTPPAPQRPLVAPRGDLEATRFAAPKSRVPGHVPHLVSHLVVPGPIGILLIVLLYMILPHPFCSQWSCRAPCRAHTRRYFVRRWLLGICCWAFCFRSSRR
jgi:hypothetical protein